MSIIHTLIDPNTQVMAEGITDWANGKIADWTTVVKGGSVLGGIGIAFFAGLKGKGRLPAVIMGIVVGSLFIWESSPVSTGLKERSTGRQKRAEAAGFSSLNPTGPISMSSSSSSWKSNEKPHGSIGSRSSPGISGVFLTERRSGAAHTT